MHVYHLAVSDQANHRILWYKVDTLLQGVLQLHHILRVDHRVHDKDKDWSGTGWLLLGVLLWNDVLKGSLVSHQLKRQTRLTDVVCIVRREIILSQTYWAQPCLEPEINLAIRVQN